MHLTDKHQAVGFKATRYQLPVFLNISVFIPNSITDIQILESACAKSALTRKNSMPNGVKRLKIGKL